MLTRKEFEGLPIFITTMSRWDGEVSSASLSLAKVLSRTNPVYYIDYPYSWADVWRERKKESVKKRLPALVFGEKILTNVPGQPDNFKGATPGAVLPI
jgi:teichuronic acid biosynthesis glycosyltransferase TuaH